MLKRAIESRKKYYQKVIYRTLFESTTTAGKTFDILLILSIIVSVITVMLDSVASVRDAIGPLLSTVEWIVTLLFTAEYSLRLYSAPKRFNYARTFFGLIDLAAILPTYLSILLPGSQFLMIVRVIRVMRMFRVLKLAAYVKEADLIVSALKSSGRKITVFLFAVLSIVVVVGALMYLIEGSASGFSSIPLAVYWAIVTMTTVGYGELIPQTPLGQTLAALVMILGYGLIAVPTGLVSVEVSQMLRQKKRYVCTKCGTAENDLAAKFCRRCATDLH